MADNMGKVTKLGEQCEHGQLARQCELCELCEALDALEMAERSRGCLAVTVLGFVFWFTVACLWWFL
jgi:hypothetical protein